MTIPFLGTPPSAHPLTDIAANIRQIVNPNWEMQLEMQRRMMADPSLVSQLAEVERNAPGTIAKMGFGKKLTDIITKTPETIAQKQTKELRDLQLQDAKNSIAEFGMKKKKFEDEQVDRAKQLAGIEAFKKFDVPKEMEAWVAGKPNKDFLAALSTAGNENQQIFMQAAGNLQQIRRLNQEHQLAMARINKQSQLDNAREDKAYQHSLTNNAFDSWQKSGVASPAAWKDVMDMEGNGSTRMQQLMQNPLLAKTDRDRELLQIGQHLQQNQQGAKDFQKSQLLVKARQSMSAAQNPKLKKEEVAPYVSDINQMYAGVRQLDPNFNISVRQKGKDIQLVDENTGAPIDDETQAIDVTRFPTPVDKTTGKPVPFRKFMDDLVADWRAQPTITISGQPRSQFASKIKKQYGNEVYNIFLKRIRE
jgi:hypothetical protein